MLARGWLRAAALLYVAGLAVHQLRYRLAYGHDAGHELAAQGHAYLNFATPVAALLLAAAAGQLLTQLVRAERRREIRRRRWLISWAAASAALLIAYAGQESLEGLLAAGHPSGLAALTAGGGWLAAPLAAIAGAFVAALLRGADAVIARVAARPRAARRRHRRARPPRPASPPRRPGRELAEHRAGRAPPLAS